MSGGFSSYLYYVVFISVAIPALLILIAVKKRKGVKRRKLPLSVDRGSAGVFFDEGRNVTVIPYATDKFGVGRATSDIFRLKSPYRAEILGRSVKTGMLSSGEGTPCEDRELISALGARDWKEFSSGKRSISVHYLKGCGIVINTTRRKPDGSYDINRPQYGRNVPGDIDDEELGKALLSLLPFCRS
jgi:hypothetical protein